MEQRPHCLCLQEPPGPGDVGVSQCGQGPWGCMFLLSLSSYKLAGFKHFALNLLWPLQEIAGPSCGANSLDGAQERAV